MSENKNYHTEGSDLDLENLPNSDDIHVNKVRHAEMIEIVSIFIIYNPMNFKNHTDKANIFMLTRMLFRRNLSMVVHFS